MSFVVMRKIGIETALAFDADFDASGFPQPSKARDHDERRLSEDPAPYEVSLAGATDLVGVAEIAERSGRSINTIQSWRRRHHDFPAPSAQLASGPVWAWPAVAPWIQARSVRAPGAAWASLD